MIEPCNRTKYVYDAENRNVSYLTAAYTYDGNGLRVKTVSGSTTTVSIFSGSKVIAEYLNGAAAASPTNEYIYAGANKIASIQSGTLVYWHYDHLSPRARTDTGGSVYDSRGHFPFGETWYGPSGAAYMFTNYYRDTESGNDYALARTYINRVGHFSTPDPLSGSVANPQSLDRYVYVLNDPIGYQDPLGLDHCVGPDGSRTLDTDRGACESNGGVWVLGNEPSCPPGTDCGSSPVSVAIPSPSPIELDLLQPAGVDNGGISGVLALLKKKYCFFIPSGEVRSIGGSLGTAGGVTGSLDAVTNFSNGQTTVFRTGGGFVGLNSEVSGQISYGIVRGSLGSDNSGFKGAFYGASGSAGIWGGYVSASGTNGPYVTGVSAGLGLPIGARFNAMGFKTNSVPMTISNSLANSAAQQLPSSTPWFAVLHFLRKPCDP